MLIKLLNLINFRNYSKFELEFSDKPTIFIGPNGAGKSNILEAIYLLSTTKSPRVDDESELIKTSEVSSFIKGSVEESNEENELMLTMVNGNHDQDSTSDIANFKKRVAINGVGKRVIDFIGFLPTVIFWPSDINMVTGSPSLRRWQLDLSLAQVDSKYKKALTVYGEILTARNKVLKRIKEGQGRMDELTYWTDELIKYGKIIAAARQEFFAFINDLKNPLGNFKFEFKESHLSKEKLLETTSREVASATTLIGPHRDDFTLFLDSRDMAKFGSRGEQRMATLAFKLAVLEYMSVVLGKRPVLLLDDVFSELDAKHRKAVALIAKKQQTIIATVELENIPQEFLDSARILKIEDGKIIFS